MTTIDSPSALSTNSWQRGEVAGEARLSRRDWMGVYDPDAFDLAKINAVLSGFKLRG